MQPLDVDLVFISAVESKEMINDDIENIPSNPTDNRPFSNVIEARFNRRSALTGGALGLAAFFIGPSFNGSGAGVAAAAGGGTSLGFGAIPSRASDGISLPDGYVGQAIMAWGDPIDGRSPRFKKDASNPAEHQERQFGQGHDGMFFFPLGPNRDNSRRGAICINHEYTLGELHFPDGLSNWNAAQDPQGTGRPRSVGRRNRSEA